LTEFPHPLDGFTIERPPSSRYTNLLLPLSHPKHGRWFLKVFLDVLHPRVHIYDCAAREVLAFRLSRSLGDLVPETYTLPGSRFGVLVKDAGAPLTASYVASLDAAGRFSLVRQLAFILVFSHWIGDIERALDHFRVGSDGVIRSIDFQCAGPGGEERVTNLVWPWIHTYTGKANVEIDDVEYMIHFGSYPPRKDAGKDGVQQLIRENIAELLDVGPFAEPCGRIQEIAKSTIEESFQGLELFQRGVERFENSEPINAIYLNMLLERRDKLLPSFKNWTQWLARKPMTSATYVLILKL